MARLPTHVAVDKTYYSTPPIVQVCVSALFARDSWCAPPLLGRGETQASGSCAWKRIVFHPAAHTCGRPNRADRAQICERLPRLRCSTQQQLLQTQNCRCWHAILLQKRFAANNTAAVTWEQDSRRKPRRRAVWRANPCPAERRLSGGSTPSTLHLDQSFEASKLEPATPQKKASPAQNDNS